MRLLSPTSSIVLLFACASVAHAGLVITAPDVVVAPNSTGNFFDIELDYPTPDEGIFEIASFSVDLHLQPFDSDLTITNVSEATDSPYLFSSFDSGVDTIGFGFDVTNNSQSAEFGDILVLAPPSSTLSLGDRVGLGRVFFDVGNTAPGTYYITVTGGLPAGLSLLEDAFGTPVPFSLQPGSITVQAQAVPEPGFALPGLAVLAFGMRRRRRREARTARCC